MADGTSVEGITVGVQDGSLLGLELPLLVGLKDNVGNSDGLKDGDSVGGLEVGLRVGPRGTIVALTKLQQIAKNRITMHLVSICLQDPQVV